MLNAYKELEDAEKRYIREDRILSVLNAIVWGQSVVFIRRKTKRLVEGSNAWWSSIDRDLQTDQLLSYFSAVGYAAIQDLEFREVATEGPLLEHFDLNMPLPPSDLPAPAFVMEGDGTMKWLTSNGWERTEPTEPLGVRYAMFATDAPANHLGHSIAATNSSEPATLTDLVRI